jgi:nitrile hydratase subunit beta
MNGVHDMGGQHGHGPVVVEAAEPVFHQPWEGRVYALMVLARGCGVFNLDEMRRAIEELPPARYLGSSYYERWLAALEALLQEEGASAPGTPPEPPAASPPPRYRAGDHVRTRNVQPRHHTRLPRYARGKSGVVELVHGPYVLPDGSAHDLPPFWQPVYTVRFTAPELWGEDGNPRDEVTLDLWEEYLE